MITSEKRSASELGDVEFVVVQLENARLDSGVLLALLKQVESGAIRLLDFILIERLPDGTHRFTEIDSEDFALAGLDLLTPGLVSDEDARHFAATLPPNSLAALVLVEPAWGKQFSRDVRHRGERVLAKHPVPAAVANAVLADALGHTVVRTASRREDTPSLR